MTHSLVIILLVTIANISFGVELEDRYEWKYIDYVWNNSQRQEAIKSGNYNPSNNILFDVDEAPDGRVFVTIVRNEGVPTSVATVSDETGPGGPLLSPYPNWSWYNDTTNCNNIINVLRIFIKCNHLFLVDFGIKDGFEGERVCPPKLLVFDLENDRLVHHVIIPSNIADNKNGRGLLATTLAYVRDCGRIDKATVYIADITGYGLVIYNRYLGFCRIESDFMKPTHPNFTIENESFYFEDGIIDLFYAPLAGNRIFKMDKHTLKKCSNLSNSEANRLTKVAGTLSGQTGPIASYSNVIFFSNIPETSILCADTTKKFDPSNSVVIVQNSEKLQFPSGLKVVKHIEGKVRKRKEGKVLIATNRLQRVVNNNLNLNETNFRILELDIMKIKKETKCCNSNHHGYNPGYRNTLSS
ncbi:Major royal jelly protein 1 [Cyphomyrmex costatus]|uniref:Major royal jelly protein 1 n=1 Tax=Cyphomyrmex costatus TaxID=456900 RepID=A0A195CNM8_9HYME|nr:Major royal jelly protein 1 [Cyphomyrmex costatus]